MSRALIAQDAAEVQEQVTIDHCQMAVKVFKFLKKIYKKGYEDRKRGASPRYPLEIGAFLESQGRKLPESGAIPATTAETSSGVPSSVSMPSTTSPPPTAPTIDSVAPTTPKDATLPTLPSEASHKGKVSA